VSTLTVAPSQDLAASGTFAAFDALSDDLVAEGHPAIRVNFGDRDIATEVRTFTSRYRQQATGPGPYGDVRTWDGSAWGFPGGRRWVRHSSAGTVAPPGGSNHGRKRSGDLAAPYNANTAAHRRAQVLAKRHNITCEGLNFGRNIEWWHWTYWGALGTIRTSSGATASTAAPTQGDDEEMISKETQQWFEGWFARTFGYMQVPGTSYGFPEATLGEIRSTVNPKLDGIVARTDASNTRLETLMHMVRTLDPAAEADLGEFERMLRESEQRTIAETRRAVEESTVALRAELVASLSAALSLPDESLEAINSTVTETVEKVLGKVFVRVD
jgi:hypothetical protein